MRTPCWSGFWWPGEGNPKKRSLLSWEDTVFDLRCGIITYPFLTESDMGEPQLHVILWETTTLAWSIAETTIRYNALRTVPSTYLLLFWRHCLFYGWWETRSPLSWTGNVCATKIMLGKVRRCNIIRQYAWKPSVQSSCPPLLVTHVTSHDLHVR